MSAVKAPMDALPPKFDVAHHQYAPKVHFGLFVSHKRLLEYALEEEILPPDFKPTTYFRAVAHVMKHLRNLTRVRSLYLATPWSAETDTFVVALYNNHTMRKRKFPDDFEAALLEAIAAELDLHDSAKWYWDVAA
ncbi:hypothetical protein FA95DRAFT_441311 [Auriscalpium vulgare]|uniref:Uncharacterized protein n=1 Tax=Auriscalpium vulgare TaxID=40419 RepID=A0ACB8RGL1_9AGAM|nr:hypothetical protein FA95DRAFT_441311 [Auriscalpium vulgare]